MPTAFSAPDSSHAGQLRLEEDQGQADHQQGEAVTDAPPCAEPRRRAGVPAVGRHQRRDRHEVVGIRGVAQPQHQRDAERGQDRRAAEQALEPQVDLLHRVK